MNNMPKRENVFLLFYIMSGVMVGIVSRKCMSVISGQLALSRGYLLFNLLGITVELVGDNAQTVFSNKRNSSVDVSDDVERAAPHCKFEWPKDQYSKHRKNVTAGPNKSRERKLSHPLSNLRLTVLFVPEETRSYYNYF